MTHTSLKKNLIKHFMIVVVALAFSTRGSGQICNDLFEPNDSKPQSKLIQSLQIYHGLISTALDIDWFKFTLPISKPNVRVTLFTLPTNYNIFLYNAVNVKIGSSKNENQDPDTIITNGLDSGTYYIKIRGKAGKSDPSNCYSLSLETSSIPFRETSGSDFTIAQSRFELYPNPVTDQLIIECNDETSSAIFYIYNLVGQKISETSAVLDEQSKSVIDVKNLDAGEYFLQIKYDNGIEVKKFAVSR